MALKDFHFPHPQFFLRLSPLHHVMGDALDSCPPPSAPARFSWTHRGIKVGKDSMIIRARCLFSCPETILWQGCLKNPPPTVGTEPSAHPKLGAPFFCQRHQGWGTSRPWEQPPCSAALANSSAIWAPFLKQKAAEAAQCYPLQGPVALTWRLTANHSDRSHCLFSSILVFLVLWKIRAGRQAIHQPINAAESFGFVLNNCAFYCYLHIYFLRQ